MKEITLPSGNIIKLRSNEKIVYKVVSMRNEHLESAMCLDSKYTLIYEINKRTTARYGKIFTFKKLIEASKFANCHDSSQIRMKILICIAINPFSVRYRNTCYGSWYIKRFHDFCNKYGYKALQNKSHCSKDGHYQLERYNQDNTTYLCTSVKPIEEYEY